jgi:geranylgeranyl diphosphate synthase type II
MLVATEIDSPFGIYLESRKQLVNKQLVKIIEEGPSDSSLQKLAASLKYTLLADGKRMRPILSIIIYELFKDNVEEIVEPACAVELIHAASLMLDDLPCMDNAEYRRGQEANHRVFGEATTILASAALLVSAFKIFSKIESVKINPIVMETADSLGRLGLIRGQFLDLESFRSITTIKELETAYYLKSGLLFENAVKIGALMGGADQERLEMLQKFGRDFGLAFQIRDDINDCILSREESGKDERLDIRNQKPTYVSLLGLAGAKKSLERIVSRIKKDLKTLPLDTAKLLDFVSLISDN